MIYLALRRYGGKKLAIVAAVWLVADYFLGPLVIAYVTVPMLTELARRDPSFMAFLYWLMGLLT